MFVAPRKRRTKPRLSKQAPPDDVPAQSPCIDTRPPFSQENTIAEPPPYTVTALDKSYAAHHQSCPQRGSVRLQSNANFLPPVLSKDIRLVAAREVPSIASPKPLQNGSDGLDDWDHRRTDHLNRGPAICDLISSKFDAVITSIDGEVFSGDERELIIYPAPDPTLRGGWGFPNREVPKIATNAISGGTAGPKSSNYFAKPSGKEKEAHVSGDWRMGTKSMVIKSIPIDDMDAIVFAMRGSQTFMDWADDSGNLCHSGFLSVARKMIMPVAARLRSLLEEDPSRRGCSLIMTGHSAGGAVASLLYAHMIAEDVRSELNILTGCFKRIHCITFGAPPVSLLPLTKSNHPQCRKSLFLSFVNEGDPVTRADRAYVHSLFKLYASPAPGSSSLATPPLLLVPKPQLKFKFKSFRPKVQKGASGRTLPSISPPTLAMPVWHVPPNSLSNAGRLVVLRAGVSGAANDVTAMVASDQQLRSVIFGDPMMHMMRLYAQRIEVLATNAITAKVWG
ncbi:hypothetical protein MMC13_003929 [Lambiella insularis]|nr:hypothetical protein [Lambiella insularis]